MKRVFALSVVCALMAACESETSSTTTLPEISDFEYLDLSADNANTKVSSVFGGVANSSSGDTAGLLGDQSASSSALALAQSIASEYLQSSSRQSRADTQSGSAACTDGGSLSIQLNGELTAPGDWVEAFFDGCVEDGVQTSGGLRIVINASSILNTDISVDYVSLSVAESGVTATLDGDLRMAWQRSGTELTSAITSNSLSMVSSEIGNTVLDDLSLVEVSDSSSQGTTLELDYNIASDLLEGRVDLETIQALSYIDSNDFPSTGIVLLTGSNSTVTLNADTGDVDTVQLTISGSVTSSETVSWASIANNDLTGLVDL